MTAIKKYVCLFYLNDSSWLWSGPNFGMGVVIAMVVVLLSQDKIDVPAMLLKIKYQKN